MNTNIYISCTGSNTKSVSRLALAPVRMFLTMSIQMFVGLI